jgi:hypothetical protein
MYLTCGVVVLLDCDRMSEKITLKIFQARISSSVGMYKLSSEVRSAWSLMDLLKTLIDIQDSIDRILYCSQSHFKHGDVGKNIIYVGIDIQFAPLLVNFI